MDLLIQAFLAKIAGITKMQVLNDPELQKRLSSILKDAADGSISNRTQIELLADLNALMVQYKLAEEFS